MKQCTVGILAHVDSGKTTLAEAMLFTAGELTRPGRVDHGDSFLDTEVWERNRGITIFSKQAMLSWQDTRFTLLDTPGHVDFSTEMERTLSVLDYAVLVISGGEGVKSHTKTLWKLLQQYQIPTFLFLNKMDIALRTPEEILMDLRQILSPGCVDFRPTRESEAFWNDLTLCSESLTEKMLEESLLTDEDIAEEIGARRIFPCFFGSALHSQGIEDLLTGLHRFTLNHYASANLASSASHSVSGRVFKIARDDHDTRLTFLKITEGSLSVREPLRGTDARTGDAWEEKITGIRIYSGLRYQTVDTVEAGMVCAVTGLSHTLPGDGFGREPRLLTRYLEPYLTYSLQLPEDVDAHTALSTLQPLSEEDPSLQLRWNAKNECIELRLMGEVQPEILAAVMASRFGLSVTFGDEHIVYRETITDTVEGIGHFEPLRHYAEVHLLLEPGERDSGLSFSTICSEDVLDRNWQRLILSHLEEQDHPGVLTGSPITDMKITLATGKAHKKHTEGGDFRQATFRSLRQGLRKASSLLLEPWFSFTLELPLAHVGRAMSDIQRMGGRFQSPLTTGDTAVLTGDCPVSEMRRYPSVLAGYTKGEGSLQLLLKGYEPCHNADEVIQSIGYDPDRDVDFPGDSVFCVHGAGHIVPWDEVEEHMHLPSVLSASPGQLSSEEMAARAEAYRERLVSDAELMAIFERTYGPVKRRLPPRAPRTKVLSDPPPSADRSSSSASSRFSSETKEWYLFVDGYNVIHSWPELQELSRSDYGAARDRLIDILRNYQGFTGCHLTVVFDAYQVSGGIGSFTRIPNVDVVYTKENETADTFIEKAVHRLAKKHMVKVVSSDDLVQKITFGDGALRCSSREFLEEVQRIEAAIRRIIESNMP